MIRNRSLIMLYAGLFAGLYLLVGTGDANAQSGDSDDLTSGRIISIDPKTPKGILKVKQAKDANPVDATVGMLIHRGYLLTLNSAPTAKAAVICGDGKTRELVAGPQGCPCRKPCTPEVCGIRYGNSTIGRTRGPDTNLGLFPAVISPRQTLLGNLRPTIRWTPIAGAKEGTTYNVTLYGYSMKVIWSRDVASATRLAYPDNEPPLIPGQTYKVVVTTEGLSSQQDHSPGLGFTTFTADQARALADEEITKKQLGLPEMQTRFLVANLYAARGLYAEAIEQSEELFTTMKEPVVAEMLGDLYAAIGLNREAEKRYLEALGMTPASDLDGLGLIQKNLAEVYENLGIFDQAIAQLEEAIKAYRQLGNIATVNDLLKKIQQLKKPGGGL